MLIRKANINDIETLLDFGMKLHLVEKEFEPMLQYSKVEVQKKYTDELKNPLSLFLIVENDNLSVGYLYAHAKKINLNSKDLVCELEVVYVSPEFRGRGLAKDLINECIIWAKGKKILNIKTDIFAKNLPSKKTFEKIGFEEYSLTYSFNLNN